MMYDLDQPKHEAEEIYHEEIGKKSMKVYKPVVKQDPKEQEQAEVEGSEDPNAGD